MLAGRVKGRDCALTERAVEVALEAMQYLRWGGVCAHTLFNGSTGF